MLRIVGYADRLNARPGEKIKFMVSCEGNRKYKTEIVRLVHGDTNPEGPGFKADLIQTIGEYQGRKQELYAGSYILVPDHASLRLEGNFSIQAMILSTTPTKGVQGILTKWDASKSAGYGLFVDDKGNLAFWLGDGKGQVEKISTGKPLMTRCWYFVAASYDAETGKVRVYQEPMIGSTNARLGIAATAVLLDTAAIVERATKIRPLSDNGVPFIMAGYQDRVQNGRPIVGGHYNGKIDRPRVANRAFARDHLNFLVENPSGEGLVAAWDFSDGIGPKGIPSSKVVDKSPNRLHGETVNLPVRAMTGYNWTSQEQVFVHAPEQYGAIHFHDDDVFDSQWEVDFEFTIPEPMKSGLYAAHVVANEDDDFIPFYVRPKKGKEAKIAFLAPTASYMAYANDHLTTDVPAAQLMVARVPVIHATDLFLSEHREYGLSTYDTHSDGSGVCYSSRLRPIVTMRPKYRHWLSPSIWQFNADLHLIDWMTAMGYDFDIITDQDLHFEGVELLRPYNVVLTGSHPEYYSTQMLDAFEFYLRDGGRMMYMGSNGFYWVISYHPENPNVIEVRKFEGSQGWKAEPGEYFMSFNAERSGLWRHRGRPPNKLVGTGFIAEGFDVCSYYRRKTDSLDPKGSWMFEGIGKDELLGNFGLVGNGAAGLELDIYESRLGTPPNTLLLASSENHTDVYLEVLEELYFNVPKVGGTDNPKVRADITYFTTSNGGGVCSFSSIAYAGSLSHNKYNNNISKLTNNVLKRFASDDPLPPLSAEGHEFDGVGPRP